MDQIYVQQTKRNTDVIIPGGGFNEIGVNVVSTYILNSINNKSNNGELN